MNGCDNIDRSVDMGNYSEFLKTVEYFRDLDDREIELLGQVCRPEVYETDRIVIEEGGRKEKFFIIKEGEVKIFKHFGGPDCSLLAEMGVGEIFGELSFVDDRPRSATVKTSKPSTLLTVDQRDFTELMRDNMSISFSIMRSIAGMIRRFNENFVESLKVRNRELEKMNTRLKDYQDHLEEQVKTRTQALTISNEKLKKEIAFRRQTESEKERVIFKLESTMARVKNLSGLFPVCIKCRKVRDEEGYWQRLERYLQEHSDAEFRESICDDCSEAFYPKFYK